MKKVKLLALMLAASISLTACGTDGGTKKAGVFAGVKTADRISTNNIIPLIRCVSGKSQIL